MTSEVPQEEVGGSSPRTTLPIALNALRWPHADEFMSRLVQGHPSAENLLDFVRGPFMRASLDESLARYQRASRVDGMLFALPSHDSLARGVLVPVHNAKAALVLGHYLSCIGLCGVVSEVLCVLRFDAAEVQCGGATLDRAKQREMWGREFERLYQGQRVGALSALGLISPPTRDLLRSIAAIRNKYMHIYGSEGGAEEADAFEVYRATCEATVAVLGLGVTNSSLVLHPGILRFLQRAPGG